MTPTEKLQRVAKLCEELQDEDNDAIVQGRIEGLAKELQVSAYQCALIYWALRGKDDFMILGGIGGKVRFKASEHKRHR
jgi:hypothetical protein